MDPQSEFLFNEKRRQVNIMMSGDSSVGKSQIISSYCKPEIRSFPEPTIGVDYIFKEYGSLILNIWDVSGSSEYKTMRKEFYTGIQVALIIFDISKKITYENIVFWIDELIKNTSEPCKIVICGNKIDLSSQRVVNEKESSLWSFLQEYEYFEVSALTGFGVKEMFERILENFTV